MLLNLFTQYRKEIESENSLARFGFNGHKIPILIHGKIIYNFLYFHSLEYVLLCYAGKKLKSIT